MEKSKEQVSDKNVDEALDAFFRGFGFTLDPKKMFDASEKVNHPQHYRSESGSEVIDVIEDFELNYNLGNAIKYILRSDKKGAQTEDLQKAIWYLKREKLRLQEEDHK